MVILLVPQQATAAQDCQLSHAIYTAGEGYSLHFMPNPRDTSASQSNTFTLRRDGFEPVLDGSVIWNNGVSRPQGRLSRDCPPDARSNEDLEVCTAWEGIIYALVKGGAKLLPDQDRPAPEALLLPDFGRAMRYSGPFLDVHDAGDVFTLAGCAP